MWKLLIIAALGSVGCLGNAWDMPEAKVVPVADDASKQEAWTYAVIDAISEWDTKLQARGCQPPFILSDDGSGYEAHLIARDRWHDDVHLGFEYSDHLDLRSALDNGPPQGGALMHEFGHAIGLGHSDPADGPSIMTPIPPPYIFPRDVEAAAKLLGC